MSIEGYGGHTPSYEDEVLTELADLDSALFWLTEQELSVPEGSVEATSIAKFSNMVDTVFLNTLHQFEPVTREQLRDRIQDL